MTRLERPFYLQMQHEVRRRVEEQNGASLPSSHSSGGVVYSYVRRGASLTSRCAFHVLSLDSSSSDSLSTVLFTCAFEKPAFCALLVLLVSREHIRQNGSIKSYY